MSFTVNPVSSEDLAAPLSLLEGFYRDGEPLPDPFIERLRREVRSGEMEVLAAKVGERVAGVAVLAYRLNVSAGGVFASVEDLYVAPEERRRGVGRALLEEVGGRCAEHGVSYIEVQVEDSEAEAFYCGAGYELESGTRVFSRSYALGVGATAEG